MGDQMRASRGRGQSHARLMLLGLLLLLQSACIALPIPHTVIEHGDISGRVVDDDTGQPVQGIRVRVDVGGLLVSGDATTDSDGCFSLPETEGWDFFWTIPLVGFCPHHFPNTLELDPRFILGPGDGRRYRALSIELRSEHPGWHLGERGESNRGLQDDVGTIRLKSYALPPRSEHGMQ